MKRGIMNCEVIIKTNEECISMSLEDPVPAMEAALPAYIPKLADEVGMNFGDYADRIKAKEAEVQEMRDNTPKVMDKLFKALGSEKEEASSLEGLLGSLFGGGRR